MSSEPVQQETIEYKIKRLLGEFHEANSCAILGPKMNGVAFLCGWFENLSREGSAWAGVEFAEAMEALVAEVSARF